jgi:tRNA(Arg) A34 adenosine deaminase TadA
MKTLENPMARALELAWEAFCSGSFPVGALLIDGSGALVAEGRNRMGEREAPVGRIRGNGLAHAEMDVLAQLSLGSFPDHTLFTTLEPCLLCRSAATMVRVGAIEYLAPDALCQGLEAMPSLNDHAARQYPAMNGPGSGPGSFFAAALPLAVLLAFSPDPNTTGDYRARVPETFAVANIIATENRWPTRDMTVGEAVAHVASLR